MTHRPPKRVSFKESEEIIDLPNLIEIQIKSFNQFLQIDKFPDEQGKYWFARSISTKSFLSNPMMKKRFSNFSLTV